jgi:hypothetical protein
MMGDFFAWVRYVSTGKTRKRKRSQTTATRRAGRVVARRYVPELLSLDQVVSIKTRNEVKAQTKYTVPIKSLTGTG